MIIIGIIAFAIWMFWDAHKNSEKDPPIYMRTSRGEESESNPISETSAAGIDESDTFNKNRAKRENHLLRSACRQTLRQMLGQPLKYTRMRLDSAYDRHKVNTTMTTIGALYYSFCELSIGDFCRNNDLEDVYEECVKDNLLNHFKRKQVSEIQNILSGNGSSNIKRLSDDLNEKIIRSHIRPYHSSICFALDEENPESKASLFNMLTITMTGSLQNSASFVLLVRKPQMT